MDKLDFEQILRYLTIGFVVTGLAFVCEPELIYEYIEKLGPAGYTFASFTVGTLLYLIYRNTFYPYIFIHLKDRLTTDNYRMFLKNKYGVQDKRQAEVLWFTFQNLNLMNEYKNLRVYSSSIHLLYMSFLSSLAAALYCWGDCQSVKAIYLFVFAVLCAVSALMSDIAAEKGELYLLKELEHDKGDSFITDLVNRLT